MKLATTCNGVGDTQIYLKIPEKLYDILFVPHVILPEPSHISIFVGRLANITSADSGDM